MFGSSSILEMSGLNRLVGGAAPRKPTNRETVNKQSWVGHVNTKKHNSRTESKNLVLYKIERQKYGFARKATSFIESFPLELM